jgi:hypothetical protein
MDFIQRINHLSIGRLLADFGVCCGGRRFAATWEPKVAQRSGDLGELSWIFGDVTI